MHDRTSQQSSSKYTPFELLYKRKARLPIEVTTSSICKSTEDDGLEVTTQQIDDHMKLMMDWTNKLHEKAKGNIIDAQKTQKKYFDAKHRPPAFKVSNLK